MPHLRDPITGYCSICNRVELNEQKNAKNWNVNESKKRNNYWRFDIKKPMHSTQQASSSSFSYLNNLSPTINRKLEDYHSHYLHSHKHLLVPTHHDDSYIPPYYDIIDPLLSYRRPLLNHYQSQMHVPSTFVNNPNTRSYNEYHYNPDGSVEKVKVIHHYHSLDNLNNKKRNVRRRKF